MATGGGYRSCQRDLICGVCDLWRGTCATADALRSWPRVDSCRSEPKSLLTPARCMQCCARVRACRTGGQVASIRLGVYRLKHCRLAGSCSGLCGACVRFAYACVVNPAAGFTAAIACAPSTLPHFSHFLAAWTMIFTTSAYLMAGLVVSLRYLLAHLLAVHFKMVAKKEFARAA